MQKVFLKIGFACNFTCNYYLFNFLAYIICSLNRKQSKVKKGNILLYLTGTLFKINSGSFTSCYVLPAVELYLNSDYLYQIINHSGYVQWYPTVRTEA